MIVDHDLEAAALGAVLITPRLWPEVSATMAEDDLASERHRAVYRAIRDLAEGSDPIEPLLVARVAGLEPLAVRAIAESCAVPGTHYARQVARMAAQRRVVAEAQRIIERAEADTDPEALADLAALEDAAGTGSGDLERPADLADASLAELEAEAQAMPAVATGIPTLDRALGGGLHPGRLYLVAARTSVGKSAFAGTVARRALDRGTETMFVSLEMTGRDVLTRLVSDAFGSDPADVSALVDGMTSERVQSWPLWFVGRADLAGIVSHCRRVSPRLLIVDYLQLVETHMRFERRDLEIAHVTRSLKNLAVRSRVPVLGCAQLNRAPGKERRDPRLTDLRESGAQEQDADAVVLLDRDVEDGATETKLILAKNRQGSTGRTTLRFDAKHTRFGEMVRGVA